MHTDTVVHMTCSHVQSRGLLVFQLTRIINEDVIEVQLVYGVEASKIQYLVRRVSDSTVTPTPLRLITTRCHFNPFLLVYMYYNVMNGTVYYTPSKYSWKESS